ncbi:MAG: hypothetical protein IPG46_04995 [Actinobacteria bacterium]|nr:hypothetical protein [Actinomycetota bacterium]
MAVGSGRCAVLADGTVRCWGRNDRGELGDGTTNSATPVEVTGITSATAASAGAYYSCAAPHRRHHLVLGTQQVGHLGDGHPGDSKHRLRSPASPTPPVSAGAHTCAVLADGTVACWGRRFDGELGDGNEPGVAHTGQGHRHHQRHSHRRRRIPLVRGPR